MPVEQEHAIITACLPEYVEPNGTTDITPPLSLRSRQLHEEELVAGVEQEQSRAPLGLPEKCVENDNTHDTTPRLSVFAPDNFEGEVSMSEKQEHPKDLIDLSDIVEEDIKPWFSVSHPYKDENCTHPGLRRNKQHINIALVLLAATILAVVILIIAKPAENKSAPFSPSSSFQPATPLDSTQVPKKSNIFNQPSHYPNADSALVTNATLMPESATTVLTVHSGISSAAPITTGPSALSPSMGIASLSAMITSLPGSPSQTISRPPSISLFTLSPPVAATQVSAMPTPSPVPLTPTPPALTPIPTTGAPTTGLPYTQNPTPSPPTTPPTVHPTSPNPITQLPISLPPTLSPTLSPSLRPSLRPTLSPTLRPTTANPTSSAPSPLPTLQPYQQQHSTDQGILDLLDWERQSLEGLLELNSRQATSSCSPPLGVSTTCCIGSFSTGGDMSAMDQQNCAIGMMQGHAIDALRVDTELFFHQNPVNSGGGIMECDVCQIIELARAQSLTIAFIGDSTQNQIAEGFACELERRNFVVIRSTMNVNQDFDGTWANRRHLTTRTMQIRSPLWENDQSVSIYFHQIYLLPAIDPTHIAHITAETDILVLVRAYQCPQLIRAAFLC
jgi:hypothetical protein